jgi:hypothetical protein
MITTTPGQASKPYYEFNANGVPLNAAGNGALVGGGFSTPALVTVGSLTNLALSTSIPVPADVESISLFVPVFTATGGTAAWGIDGVMDLATNFVLLGATAAAASATSPTGPMISAGRFLHYQANVSQPCVLPSTIRLRVFGTFTALTNYYWEMYFR